MVLLLSWPVPAVTTFAKPEQVGLSSERLARIGELIDRQIENRVLSGAVALVARRGRVAYLESRGIGDIQSKKPMHKESLFRIASMSKPITAVAILMLVEEGKVRLTDPVSRFIPEFKSLKVAVPAGPSSGAPADSQFSTTPAERDITIRDLLTHTSGLMSGGISAKEAARHPRRPDETLADYIPRL
ncbi:MAG TPA: serine hydrolase domain-containing protein, partial [Vicinamibacterales bacterium]|nr:serine hydrolase domain-containing protein [Vicinamibacterales bacterium]